MPYSLEREVWLRTDEVEEFVDSLEHAAKLAAQVNDDVKVWKWLIIAQHLALQGACVCALRGHDSAGITMLTKKSSQRVWHWLDVESQRDSPPPMPAKKLANLEVLFSRVRDPSVLPAPHTLCANADVVADIDKLNRLRNEFIHFVPDGFSLEVSGMPRIVAGAADAIEHLALQHPTFWNCLHQPDRDRIASALASLRQIQ